MKRFSFSSLRVRLTLVIVLSMLPVLGLTVFTYIEERNQILSHVKNQMQLITYFASDTQERLIETTRQLLVALSKIPRLRDIDSKTCNSYFAEVLAENPKYANLGIILRDGSLFCSGVPSTQPSSYSDQPWFRSSIENRDRVIGVSQVVDSGGNPTFNFSYPLIDDSGGLQSVLFAALDLSQLNQLAFQIQLPGMAEFLMVSSDRSVLAYLPDPEKIVGKSFPDAPLLDAILAEGRGEIEIEGLDGVKRLYAFTPLSSTVDTGLYVSIGIPKALAYSETNRVLMYHVVGLGLITFLALAVVWTAGNTMIRRVHALIGAAQQLSIGDLGARTGLPHGQGELGRLAEAFDDMAEALEGRAKQLREAETRYRTLVEQLPMITYTARPDEVRSTLYISPQVKDILGFTQDEWLTDEALWMRTIHPEDVAQVLQSLKKCYASREPFCCEYRVFSREGNPLWFLDEAVMIGGDADGFSYLQGVMRDITQHRLAEQKLLDYQKQLRSLSSQLSLVEERERHRIATDLHDRVGQCLALSRIKLGLLKESAGSGEYAQSIEEIRKLIIQAIQDTRSLIFKISSPILYELGIEAALEWLAEQTQREHGIEVRCETEGRQMVLDNDVRVLLFRATSELLVNVVKHSGARHATITVAADSDCIRIGVWDDGIGFDVSKDGFRWGSTDGFGLFSIRERLAHVGGSMEIESQKGEGTTITLVAPLKPDADS